MQFPFISRRKYDALQEKHKTVVEQLTEEVEENSNFQHQISKLGFKNKNLQIKNDNQYKEIIKLRGKLHRNRNAKGVFIK